MEIDLEVWQLILVVVGLVVLGGCVGFLLWRCAGCVQRRSNERKRRHDEAAALSLQEIAPQAGSASAHMPLESSRSSNAHSAQDAPKCLPAASPVPTHHSQSQSPPPPPPCASDDERSDVALSPQPVEAPAYSVDQAENPASPGNTQTIPKTGDGQPAPAPAWNDCVVLHVGTPSTDATPREAASAAGLREVNIDDICKDAASAVPVARQLSLDVPPRDKSPSVDVPARQASPAGYVGGAVVLPVADGACDSLLNDIRRQIAHSEEPAAAKVSEPPAGDDEGERRCASTPMQVSPPSQRRWETPNLTDQENMQFLPYHLCPPHGTQVPKAAPAAEWIVASNSGSQSPERGTSDAPPQRQPPTFNLTIKRQASGSVTLTPSTAPPTAVVPPRPISTGAAHAVQRAPHPFAKRPTLSMPTTDRSPTAHGDEHGHERGLGAVRDLEGCTVLRGGPRPPDTHVRTGAPHDPLADLPAAARTPQCDRSPAAHIASQGPTVAAIPGGAIDVAGPDPLAARRAPTRRVPPAAARTPPAPQPQAAVDAPADASVVAAARPPLSHSPFAAAGVAGAGAAGVAGRGTGPNRRIVPVGQRFETPPRKGPFPTPGSRNGSVLSAVSARLGTQGQPTPARQVTSPTESQPEPAVGARVTFSAPQGGHAEASRIENIGMVPAPAYAADGSVVRQGGSFAGVRKNIFYFSEVVAEWERKVGADVGPLPPPTPVEVADDPSCAGVAEEDWLLLDEATRIREGIPRGSTAEEYIAVFSEGMERLRAAHTVTLRAH